MGGRGWPGGLVASWPGHSSRLVESGRLVRRMSHHVDPAAIAEEARTVRLDAVLGPPRRSVPVGDSSTPESRTLTPLIMVRNRCVFVVSSLAGIVLKLPRVSAPVQNARVWGANGRRVSQGRCRVVGCGAHSVFLFGLYWCIPMLASMLQRVPAISYRWLAGWTIMWQARVERIILCSI